jgi:hypothetical protein
LSLVSLATKYPAAPLFFVPLIRKKWVKKYPRAWITAYAGSLLALVLAIKYFSEIQIGTLTYFANF